MLVVNLSLKQMTIEGEKVALPEVVSSCGNDCLKMGRSSNQLSRQLRIFHRRPKRSLNSIQGTFNFQIFSIVGVEYMFTVSNLSHFTTSGETSAGKSSLINLLLGKNIMPTSIQQNTLTICEVSYGPAEEAVLHFANRRKPPRVLTGDTFDKFKYYIQEPIENENWCEWIEIRIPNPLLKVKKLIACAL